MSKNIRLAVGGFNTDAISVFQESFVAEASNDAVLGAYWAGMWVGACGWACSSARLENFISIAFRDWWKHLEVLDRVGLWWAFDGSNAFSAVVFAEESLFASASGFADTWAQWVGVFAGTIATFALTVFFVFLALFHWWEHHERFRLNLSGAFTSGNAFTGIISEMAFFAGATRNADTWAQWVGFLARSIASFALTVFFIIAAHLGCHGGSFGSWHAASFRMDAHTVFVFQESGFAEATDNALHSADRWVWFGTGGRAGGSACEEHFVFFALRQFRWVSEELHGWGIALVGWRAGSTSIAQMTFFAEASDDALSGANWARVWVSAGRGASGAAGIEKFIGWAFWFGLRELHGDIVVTGLAFFHANTFTFGVLQESLVTETTDDALEGTKGWWFGFGTIWYASGSASQKFGIGTAFFIDGKSRGGDSEAEGANSQQ